MATYQDTTRGRRRLDLPEGQRLIDATHFGRERFRFALLRGQRKLPTLNIDPYVERCNWGRSSGVTTGELNFRRPLTGQQAGAIVRGDRVRCEVDIYSNGTWRPLWYMTVNTPNHDVTAGEISLALKSGLKNFQASKRAFRFRKKTANQITRNLCKRFHIKIGRLPKSKYKIPKLTKKNTSPYAMIVAAWKEEREHSGRRFDIDISRGVLDVTELREPRYMLVMGKMIAELTIEMALAQMVSTVIVTTHQKRSGKSKRIRVKVTDRKRRERYGYIVKKVNLKGRHSRKAARRYGKEQLARALTKRDDITFTHFGIPFLRRGDAIRLQVPEADLNQLCFVKSVRHDLSPGNYQMEVTVGFTDPWKDVKKERAKKKRELAAARRRRKMRSQSASHAKPKKASWRS